MTSAADFTLRFPEFGEQPQAVIEGALAEATRSTDAQVWGTFQDDGILYLTAHLLAARTVQLGLQIGSPAGSPTGMGLDSTLHGQEYRRLLDSLPLTGLVI